MQLNTSRYMAETSALSSELSVMGLAGVDQQKKTTHWLLDWTDKNSTVASSTSSNSLCVQGLAIVWQASVYCLTVLQQCCPTCCLWAVQLLLRLPAVAVATRVSELTLSPLAPTSCPCSWGWGRVAGSKEPVAGQLGEGDLGTVHSAAEEC